MCRALLWTLPLLLLLPTARAQDDKKTAKPGDKQTPISVKPDKNQTPAEESRSLRKEFEDKQQQVQKAYQEAKTPEEKKKAFEKWPKPEDYTGRALDAALKSPKEPFAIDALLWVAQLAQGSPSGEKAMELLVKDHIQSKQLGDVCDVLSYSDAPSGEKYLEIIMEKSPHHDVKGGACYALAHYLKSRAERDNQEKTRDQDNKKAEQLLERVIEKYSAVKHWQSTLAVAAKGDLFEIRNLAIGKIAPEIEGEDIDGKKLKLSDYRGKVVVLDFWGNW
jgi:hypothetical protein